MPWHNYWRCRNELRNKERIEDGFIDSPRNFKDCTEPGIYPCLLCALFRTIIVSRYC